MCVGPALVGGLGVGPAVVYSAAVSIGVIGVDPVVAIFAVYVGVIYGSSCDVCLLSLFYMETNTLCILYFITSYSLTPYTTS